MVKIYDHKINFLELIKYFKFYTNFLTMFLVFHPTSLLWLLISKCVVKWKDIKQKQEDNWVWNWLVTFPYMSFLYCPSLLSMQHYFISINCSNEIILRFIPKEFIFTLLLHCPRLLFAPSHARKRWRRHKKVVEQTTFLLLFCHICIKN